MIWVMKETSNLIFLSKNKFLDTLDTKDKDKCKTLANFVNFH